MKVARRLFQLHHTGIKTPRGWTSKWVNTFVHFNCTIQELKPLKKSSSSANSISFQLHHTGIKTENSKNCTIVSVLFQLHHTGIKTTFRSFSISFSFYFNCTIQELKLFSLTDAFFLCSSFQLHHTGIKTVLYGDERRADCGFQLHHTGIKTTNRTAICAGK